MGDTAIDLFAAEYAPFTIALLAMVAIGVAELVGLLVGASASSAIDSALPQIDFEADGPDIGAGAVGPLAQTLGWLSVGKLPFLILIVIFLTSFALTGYAVQSAAAGLLGFPLPGLLAAIPALFGGAFGMRHIGRWLARIFPREHTEVASQRELIGSIATVIRGTAKRGAPAEAKATDLRGRTHYLLVEPEEEADALDAGSRVLVVRQEGHIFRVVTKFKDKTEL